MNSSENKRERRSSSWHNEIELCSFWFLSSSSKHSYALWGLMSIPDCNCVFPFVNDKQTNKKEIVGQSTKNTFLHFCLSVDFIKKLLSKVIESSANSWILQSSVPPTHDVVGRTNFPLRVCAVHPRAHPLSVSCFTPVWFSKRPTVFGFENAHNRNISWSFFISEEIGTWSVRPSQCRQSSLIDCDIGFSWSLPLNAWLPLRTDWTTDPQTESWSGAGAPEDYWAAGSRQQTFNPFGLSVGGEMLGTTTCNNSEVMFYSDRTVRPGVKFVSHTRTVISKAPTNSRRCLHLLFPLLNVSAGKS